MKNFWPDLLFYLLVAVFYGFPVFVVVFAVVRAVLARFRPQEPHPKRWALLSAGLATPLLCWAGVYLALFLYLYYPHRSFTPERWTANPTHRYELVQDLQANQALMGISMQEVQQLLGKPDNQSATSWEYHLGMTPKLVPIDGDALSLRFEDGKVVSYYVHET